MYYDEATWNSTIQPNGYLELVFYADGHNLGFWDADDYWTSTTPPTCGELFWQTLVASNVDLGGDKTKTIPYEIKDLDTGVVVFSGSVTMTAGNCTAVKVS